MPHRFGQVAPREGDRAIIDIGSNTIRLVIYGGPARAPSVLYNEKVTARLGRAVAESGRLSDRASTQALAVLARFETLLRLRGVSDVQTAATAAVRDASNGGEFLERVAALGLEPRLLSGEEEAITSASGVMAAFPGAKGVVGDLGGGSLELVDIDGHDLAHGTSLPLGTLRLPALRAPGPDKFGRRVRTMMQAVDWRGQHDQTLYLVGGSLRALARYAMVRREWPIDDPHGFELPAEEALTVARGLASGKALRTLSEVERKRLAGLFGISASRLASLPDAAALVGVLVRELRPQRLIFSAWGLREGLLARRLSAAQLKLDPLQTGIRAFVQVRSPWAAEAGASVAAWTAPVCGSLGPGWEGLRQAATMIALASMHIEPNLRAEEATDWALRKRWIGIDSAGRAMMALTAMANSGRTAIPPELLRLAPIGALREAQAWGLATRLARRFTGALRPALEGSALIVERGRLVLAARADLASLYNETVDKDMRLLAECLGLTSEFRAVPVGEPVA